MTNSRPPGEASMEASREFFETAVRRHITCAFAESLTAGNLSAELVKYPGASAVLAGGVTSYSNRVKTELLGVKPETLLTWGAVSSETVEEMLSGLSGLIEADIYAAVSGIAGPEGGSASKPVGTVFTGILYRGNMHISRHQFMGGRSDIIEQTLGWVYQSMASLIKE